ncbi:MAG TPA: DUF1800 domain-containing protein [Gammaproteobacteria bacterium]|nr:DUF1800 domain-containing protein [Gammaproteobacteria bacterium]
MRAVVIFALVGLFYSASAFADPLDLRPIQDSDWDRDKVRHLASRAGFGATPEEISTLLKLGPESAVKAFLTSRPPQELQQFDHSGIFDPGLDPFPASRPATTRMAKQTGSALGIMVKPGGNRPLQPVVDKFFYWLRASRLESDRVAYWWANRMLRQPYPLAEKMALFWHGHFAANEDKVRDYRKMLKQLELFQQAGLGSFRDLLIGVAQDPAMLVFLDAGVNTKDSPNENFAREIMELFTMGVGNYGESDVREAARAFTGWSVDNLSFYVNEQLHDGERKKILGSVGLFDGVDVIDIILQQPVASEFIAAKIYRYFVSVEIGDAGVKQLGRLLRQKNYQIADFLQVLLLSEDFYQSRGARIKGPVELVVSTYKKLGLEQIPGVPDFNQATQAIGQRLMHPPTVAGWSHGRSWVTPSLLYERGNFVLDVLFPDMSFVPPDRFPVYTPEVAQVQQRLRQGMTISAATRPTGVQQGGMMAQSNALADRDEDFNTRIGSMRGWQMALERVKPILRAPARVRLSTEVLSAGVKTPRDVVGYFADKYFSVELAPEVLQELEQSLAEDLAGNEVAAARSYLEAPLRRLLHKMLSLPDYQLG